MLLSLAAPPRDVFFVFEPLNRGLLRIGSLALFGALNAGSLLAVAARSALLVVSSSLSMSLAILSFSGVCVSLIISSNDLILFVPCTGLVAFGSVTMSGTKLSSK